MREAHQSHCRICKWRSHIWWREEMAGCESTWHVYEEHQDAWIELFGDRPPTDPDPRKLLTARDHAGEN